MDLGFYTGELPHLSAVLQDPEHSLTFVMEDLQARRQECLVGGRSGADLEDWVNALQRQGLALVASTQGRANLEAWLALVEE